MCNHAAMPLRADKHAHPDRHGAPIMREALGAGAPPACGPAGRSVPRSIYLRSETIQMAASQPCPGGNYAGRAQRGPSGFCRGLFRKGSL